MKLKTSLKIGAAGMLAAAGFFTKKFFETFDGKRFAFDKVNDFVYSFCKNFAKIIPDDHFPYAFEYDNIGFMAGNEEIAKEPIENAVWRCGYSKASLLPDEITDGTYYVGGYLHMPPNVANDVLDDQMFRCYALNDGRATSVFGVIDCVGISNHDIRDIRIALADFCRENNVVSINISASHSHSEIDTQGLWGDLFEMLKKNPLKIINGEGDYLSGRNPEHMANLKTRCAESIKEAVLNMKTGKLYSSVVDGTRFVRDKRPPNVMVTDILNIKFIPDDGSAPTHAVYMAAHPTQFGDDNKMISADFPYYVCEELEKNGENALFFQSAELAVATDRGPNVPEGLDRIGEIQAYGRAVGRYCIDNYDQNAKEIKPLLNVRNHEVFLAVENYLYLIIGRLRIVTNNMVRVGDKKTDMNFVTEVGMIKLGDDLNIVMVPGEMAPELLLGGCFSAEESYNREEWTMPPMKDMASGYMHCVGLCNDAIGYILPDNDFGSVIAPLHYEEAVSTGKRAGSQIVGAFKKVAAEFQ
ncbi:MAG TPA: hypothetical protein GXZ23_07985 [Clostridiales bacterium]|nr:hypothetical protein [Clostridiales bacterium]